MYSPERALEQAHVMWDSNDTKQQIKAIKEYRAILQKKDPIDPARHWLKDDRDTLYRRIITHDVKFTLDEDKAGEWVIAAWDDGLRDLRFTDEKVKAFWDKATEPLKRKNRLKKPAHSNRSDSSNNEAQKPEGRFEKIPGLDGQ
jgi:hypothetical protein